MLNMTLSESDVANAIGIYLMIKGYSINGGMTVTTIKGDIHNVVVTDLRPINIDLKRLQEVVKSL